MTFIFSMGVDLNLGYAGNVGQDRWSKVKVKCPKLCFDITVTLLQGQRSGSRSMVRRVQGHGSRLNIKVKLLGRCG